MNSSPSFTPGAYFAGYTINQRLGSGGTGTVYAATDPETKQPIALKILHSLGDYQALQKEACCLAQFSHPNIIKVYRFDEYNGYPYICMELIDGDTLTSWLRRDLHTADEIVKLFIEIGQGLVAIHAAGLVHADFKPGNVLIDEDGKPYIIDFGSARGFRESRKGTSKSYNGSAEYMAPEQFSEQPLSTKTDQFSFCVALHEALYGVRPFPGRRASEIEFNVTQGRIYMPANLKRPLYRYEVVVRGLQNNSEGRYRSMCELLTALK